MASKAALFAGNAGHAFRELIAAAASAAPLATTFFGVFDDGAAGTRLGATSLACLLAVLLTLPDCGLQTVKTRAYTLLPAAITSCGVAFFQACISRTPASYEPPMDYFGWGTVQRAVLVMSLLLFLSRGGSRSCSLQASCHLVSALVLNANEVHLVEFVYPGKKDEVRLVQGSGALLMLVMLTGAAPRRCAGAALARAAPALLAGAQGLALYADPGIYGVNVDKDEQLTKGMELRMLFSFGLQAYASQAARGGCGGDGGLRLEGGLAAQWLACAVQSVILLHAAVERQVASPARAPALEVGAQAAILCLDLLAVAVAADPDLRQQQTRREDVGRSTVATTGGGGAEGAQDDETGLEKAVLDQVKRVANTLKDGGHEGVLSDWKSVDYILSVGEFINVGALLQQDQVKLAVCLLVNIASLVSTSIAYLESKLGDCTDNLFCETGLSLLAFGCFVFSWLVNLSTLLNAGHTWPFALRDPSLRFILPMQSMGAAFKLGLAHSDRLADLTRTGLMLTSSATLLWSFFLVTKDVLVGDHRAEMWKKSTAPRSTTMAFVSALLFTKVGSLLIFLTVLQPRPDHKIFSFEAVTMIAFGLSCGDVLLNEIAHVMRRGGARATADGARATATAIAVLCLVAVTMVHALEMSGGGDWVVGVGKRWTCRKSFDCLLGLALSCVFSSYALGEADPVWKLQDSQQPLLLLSADDDADAGIGA